MRLESTLSRIDVHAYRARTVFPQVVPLHEEHQQCVELLVPIHDAQEVSGVSLRENLGHACHQNVSM